MKFEKIEPGMTLFDVHKQKAGNTTMSTIGVWRVKVLSVDRVNCRADVSWNGNRRETWSARRLEKLRTKEPVLVRTHFGITRLQTPAERKAAKELAA